MIKDWMLLSSYFSLDFIKDQILSSSVQQGIPVTRVAFVGDGKPSKGSTYKLHHILHVPKFLWTAYSRRSRVSKSYRYKRYLYAVLFVKLLFATVQWQVREAFFLFCWVCIWGKGEKFLPLSLSDYQLCRIQRWLI